MTATIITREAVFREADRLHAEGINPTQVRICARLGGSQTTIGPFLREWRMEKVANDPDGSAPVPERLRAAIEQMSTSLWKAMELESAERQTAALTIAQKKADASQVDFEEIVAQLKIAEDKIEKLEALAETRGKKLEEAQLEIARNEGVHSQLEKDLNEEKSARKAAEAAANEAKGEANVLRQQLDGRKRSARTKKGESPK